ncbi:MAG: Xaa-Pro peptidase family protein [Anaerolineae bacterium]
MNRKARVEELRRMLNEQGLDGILITQPQNSLYLSGFGPSVQPDEIEGALFITEDDSILMTDFRYLEQAEREARAFRLFKVERGDEGMVKALPGLLEGVGAKRVGFEAEHLTFARYQKWASALEGSEWVPTSGLVEEIRAIKDQDEIEAIRKAVALADETYAYLREYIRPGLTEREVAWEAEVYMRQGGAEKIAFDLIIAGGPNGALPHATTTERALREGEPVVIDIGARVESYHSDLTRTLYLGEPDAKFQEVYALVRRAQDSALEGIRGGMKGKEADGLARQVIEEAGYGEDFGHGLGHGVGLAVHEKPRATKRSEEELQPGMTLTVEPGVYITGWGGVRMEDMVVIREEGVEVLSRASKEPTLLSPGIL